MKLPKFFPHRPAAERQRLSRIRHLLSEPGILHGSLQSNRRRCGKPTCRCASGELHTSLHLRIMENGKQVSIHVPAAWEERVRKWLDRDREVRELLLELSAFYAARLRERKE